MTSTRKRKEPWRHGEPSDIGRFLEDQSELIEEVGRLQKSLAYRLGLKPRHLREACDRFRNRMDGIRDEASRHNAELAKSLAPGIGASVNPVEGCDLDEQQLSAIAMDVRSRLVLAGAGTGKTTAVIGLAKHLVGSGAASPDEILFLSFTNNSVDDLSRRISSEVGCRMNVSTFHRLGLRIIAESRGKVPKVSRIDLREFVKDDLSSRMSDRRYMAGVVDYLARDCRYVEPSSGQEGDFSRYLSENPLVTINGEHVKSFGEAEIADHLLLSGIGYVYEDGYPLDTRDGRHGQYRPDFHIAGTDVYIEYFGIDRDGSVAPFITSDGGDPSEEYRAGIEWKRTLHRENGTIMIELYAYDR